MVKEKKKIADVDVGVISDSGGLEYTAGLSAEDGTSQCKTGEEKLFPKHDDDGTGPPMQSVCKPTTVVKGKLC
jgi:hypothetical protein